MECFHCAEDLAVLIRKPNEEEEKRTISISPGTGCWPWSFNCKDQTSWLHKHKLRDIKAGGYFQICFSDSWKSSVAR